MIASTSFHYLLRLILWIPLIVFSLLLSHNAILYFTHGGDYGILPEKALARQDWLWNLCFYTHLPSGILCLMIPFVSFAKKLFRSGVILHRFLGRIYVWITIIVVCPTGMYLALYAKGGLVTQVGFLLQGTLLMLFTWRGYQHIVNRNSEGHVREMIRSYAVATVVLSFRILHIIFFLLQVPYHDNYAISQWLGLTGNLLIAEIIIASMAIVKKRSIHLNSKYYETV